MIWPEYPGPAADHLRPPNVCECVLHVYFFL